LCAPDAPPEPAGIEELVAQKRELRARLQARFIAAHPELTESNFGFKGPLRWGYRRFDQRLYVPVGRIYPGLPSRMAFTLYTGSGMAAITATLETLDTLVPGSLSLAVDGYFETLRMAGRLQNLRGAVEKPGNVLYLDSVTADERPVALAGVELVLFDTTCYDAESPRIAAAVEACRAAHIPCILLRSHLKLDCLGTEFGRLGSIVVVLTDGLQAPLMKKLRAGILDRLSLWGAHFSPDAVFPLMEAARPLTRLRNQAMVAANLAARRIDCAPTGITVQHHGCFFTLRPVYDTIWACGRYQARLISALNAAGLPARDLPSFGYDLIAVALLRAPWKRQASIRVALPDWPPELVERALEVIGEETSTWLPTVDP
jgi:hypothetical protein